MPHLPSITPWRKFPENSQHGGEAQLALYGAIDWAENYGFDIPSNPDEFYKGAGYHWFFRYFYVVNSQRKELIMHVTSEPDDSGYHCMEVTLERK